MLTVSASETAVKLPQAWGCLGREGYLLSASASVTAPSGVSARPSTRSATSSCASSCARGAAR
jgi:hypothetical protein